MYHQFPDSVPRLQEELAHQLDHIRRHYTILSMTEIGLALRSGNKLPPNALAVTVDDGCRDFLLQAHPVFRAYNMPVLVYLVSGYLDGKLWFWWHQAAYAISSTKRSKFKLPLAPGKEPTSFLIETEVQRDQAIDTIVKAMKRLAPEERGPFTNGQLAQILDVDLPKEPPAHMSPLRWDEVRTLQTEGVDFGAHTITHPRLSRIKDREKLMAEIAGSKKRLEEELRRPVLHFSYPFGLSDDYDDSTVSAAAECGFLTATTAELGMNDQDSNPLRLHRICMEPVMNYEYFRERLAGLHLG